ncbi:unnamed protein product, partial [Brassica rapa]
FACSSPRGIRNPKKKKSKARRRLRWRWRSLDLQIHLFKSKGNPASSLFHWNWRSVLSSLARSRRRLIPRSFSKAQSTSVRFRSKTTRSNPPQNH